MILEPEVYHLRFPENEDDLYVAFQRYAKIVSYIKLCGHKSDVHSYSMSIGMRDITFHGTLNDSIFECVNVEHIVASHWRFSIPNYWYKQRCGAYEPKSFERPMDFVHEFYEFVDDYLDSEA